MRGGASFAAFLCVGGTGAMTCWAKVDRWDMTDVCVTQIITAPSHKCERALALSFCLFVVAVGRKHGSEETDEPRGLKKRLGQKTTKTSK